MESAKEASLLILLRKRNGIRAGWERGYRAGLVKYRGTETRHRARLPEVTAQLCGAVLEGAGRKVSGDGLTQAPSVTASACFASQPLASSLGLASLGGKEGGRAAHRGWAGPPTPQPGGRGCCSPPPACGNFTAGLPAGISGAAQPAKRIYLHGSRLVRCAGRGGMNSHRWRRVGCSSHELCSLPARCRQALCLLSGWLPAPAPGTADCLHHLPHSETSPKAADAYRAPFPVISKHPLASCEPATAPKGGTLSIAAG